jgi:hypothetical protein
VNATLAASVLDAWEDCQQRGHSAVAERLLHIGDTDATRERRGEQSVGHRDHLLLGIYESMFGRELELRTACPTCGEELEVAAKTEEFVRSHDADGAIHELVVDSTRVLFRLPTSIDVVEACRENDDSSRVQALWRRCTRVTCDGHDIDPDEVSEIVRTRVQDEMFRIDAQAVVQLDLNCPECSTRWAADFDIVPVLWAEIDHRARRQLFDVHRLADAYGWDEATVLGLGPARRDFYLSQL